MIPTWIILAVIAGIGSNIFNFFGRYILKDGGDSSSWAWTFELLRLIIFIPLLFFDFKFNITFKSIIILLSLGLTEFISVYLYMKMHKHTHLSISTIISRTKLVWIPVIAFLFLGERLTLMEYLGIGILFLGLSIVVAPHKFFVDKGAIYANSAAFTMAILAILMKQATSFASPPVIMIFFSLPSVILFPIFMKDSKKRLITDNFSKLAPKLTAVIINAIAMYLFILALNFGDVSRVNAIYQGMLIVGVLAGIFILREKQDIARKLIGTIVTVIGVILLT